MSVSPRLFVWVPKQLRLVPLDSLNAAELAVQYAFVIAAAMSLVDLLSVLSSSDLLKAGRPLGGMGTGLSDAVGGRL